MKKVVLSLILVLVSFVAFAQQDNTGSHSHPAMKMPSIDVFADGIWATFMIMRNEHHRNMLKNMKMKEDIEPGTTHDIMILLRDEKTGKELANIPAKITVSDPSSNEQTKKGNYKEMMKTYDAYFKMAEKGKYVIKALFKAQDNERSIGISYDMP